MIVAAFLSHLLSRIGHSDGGAAQTTFGQNSPTVQGNFHGPVTFNTPPPERQPERQPGPRPTSPQIGYAVPLRPLPASTPDLPLIALLMRVYHKLGPAPEEPSRKDAFRRKVNLHIADTVKTHGLHVWARLGDFPLGLISEHSWRHAVLDHLKGELRIPNDYRVTTYTDIHFNRAEIAPYWPEEPPSTTNAGNA